MKKSVFIAEKPSVAQEFAKALHIHFTKKDGYLEADNTIVTWCVGHLVTMSYPEKYDEKYKRWSFDMLPFLPQDFLYEVIPSVKKQFDIVKKILTSKDVETIYVCTDSGREGEYIYRLVKQMAGVEGKVEKRVWIDSQTEEEIVKGIENAKLLSEYDSLSEAAYLRAKEDYLMGINFSRALTLKYGRNISNYLKTDRTVISVGRVMTCVLGMVVKREREIRAFVKTPFFKIMTNVRLTLEEHEEETKQSSQFEAEWRVSPKSRYYKTPFLYKDNGFKDKQKAQELVDFMSETLPEQGIIEAIERKKETKNPPLLYNLAELQNDCSKLFKISPDETLTIVQELYEKKLVTYPRTDARVVSSAVCKEIYKNISGLKNEIIVRRFLSIFYSATIYNKVAVTIVCKNEIFAASFKMLVDEGYLKVTQNSFARQQEDNKINTVVNLSLMEQLKKCKKNDVVHLMDFYIKEGETSPPKRYNSGSIILAMENAGQLIEDEELRAQIKGSGIGTSATRADILKKLNRIEYMYTNKKTQIITPTKLGEIVYDVVAKSIYHLLNPELTASWEKGLTYVAQGTITAKEYLDKLEGFVERRTIQVKNLNNQTELISLFDESSKNYK